MHKSRDPTKLKQFPSCARYSLPIHDRLLQEELRRIDKSSREEARAAQHAIILKLATLAHARHVRDKKIDTLTRLMASDSTKLKLQAIHSQRSSSAPRSVAKRNANEFKRKLSKDVQSGQAKEGPPLKSSSSGSSGRSGVSQVTRFAEEPEIFPQTPAKRKPIRSRAYSVDLLANPKISAKRRQSAPEVVVTPAATEMSTDMAESLEPRFQEGHLSPAYSAVTEFFAPDRPLTQQDISETEEEPTITKGSKTYTENISEEEPALASDSKSPLKDPSGLPTSEDTSERRGGLGSAATSLSSALFLKKSSRKVSRSSTSSSRRRSSHLSPKGQVKLQNEEFNPEKDPRFTDLLAALKSTLLADVAARTTRVPRDYTSSDVSTASNRQSTTESRSLMGAGRSSSKSTKSSFS